MGDDDSTDLSGVDAASHLGISGEGQNVLTGLTADSLSIFSGDEVASLQTQLNAFGDLHASLSSLTRHGCWCGPGHVCEEEKDDIDSCCHAHDLAYDAVGVSADIMWSTESIKKTVEADQALVDCLRSKTASDTSAEVYQEGAILLFSRRAEIGRLLRKLPF